MAEASLLERLTMGAVLAPMAGVTDLPFRCICLEMGAAYSVTEMVSAKGYTMTGERLRATRELLATAPQEQGRVALQIFGHEPEVCAQAAEALTRNDRFFMLDLNMGCPVPKVCGNGEGSALMAKPELAYAIMREIVAASHVPVSVKMRLGFDANATAYQTIGPLAEKAGVSLLTLHARTRSQYYSGVADWNAIRDLKECVSIPVIGNGDIANWQDALRMLDETGCDGIAVGRAAEGNPFIFREIREALAGRTPEAPTLLERRGMLLRHAQALTAFKGEVIGIREMRRHAVSYVRGMRDAAEFRRQINAIQTLPELEEAVNRFFDGNRDM